MKLFLLMQDGNSSKGKLVQDLTIAFSSYDLERIRPYLAENIIWTLVGDTPVEGKENFLSTLGEMMGNAAAELHIHQILTHGKEAAVHGEMVMENGERYGFADFYVFTSASAKKVQTITSYVIQK